MELDELEEVEPDEVQLEEVGTWGRARWDEYPLEAGFR